MMKSVYTYIEKWELPYYLQKYDVIDYQSISTSGSNITIQFREKQELINDPTGQSHSSILDDISTYKLVEELKIRSGVDAMTLGEDVDFEISYGQKTISDVGSAIILVVKD